MNNVSVEERAFEANRKAVLAALANTDLPYLLVEFEGSCDSGQLGEPDLPNGMPISSMAELAETPVTHTFIVYENRVLGLRDKQLSLKDAVRDLAYCALEHTQPGWEINGGSEGRILFVLKPDELGDPGMSADREKLSELSPGTVVVEYNGTPDDSEFSEPDVTGELPEGMLDILRASFAGTDVCGLYVEYEGSGDSGLIMGASVEELRYASDTGAPFRCETGKNPQDVCSNQVLLPTKKAGEMLPLSEALLELTEKLLENHFPGWADNSGSSGKLMIDLVEGKARIEHNAYFYRELDTQIDFV